MGGIQIIVKRTFKFALIAAVCSIFAVACDLREEEEWFIECEKTEAPTLVGVWNFSELRFFTRLDTIEPFDPNFCIGSTCDRIRIEVFEDRKYQLDYTLIRRLADSTVLDTLKGFESGLLNYNYCYYQNLTVDPDSTAGSGRNIGEIVFLPNGGTQYVSDLEFNDTLFFVQRLRIDTLQLRVTFKPN